MATKVNRISQRRILDKQFCNIEKGKDEVSQTIENFMSLRRIMVFINGNSYFSGKNIVYDSHKYNSLREFLLDIAALLPRDVNLAKGIRRLFTPRGKHVVRTLNELKDGNIYVCAGIEPFKSVPYSFHRKNQQHEELHQAPLETPSFILAIPAKNEVPAVTGTVLPLPTQSHSLRNSHPLLMCGTRVPAGMTQSTNKFAPLYDTDRPVPNNLTPFSQGTGSKRRLCGTLRLLLADGKTTGSRQLIVIRSNGNGTEYTALKVLICRRAVQTLGQVICEISEAFGPRWSHDPIRHMYSLTGREVRSITDLFRQQKVFIATGIQRLFGPGPVANRLSLSTYPKHQPEDRDIVLFTGEQIRDILNEFWPDHPDPNSVVIQWEKRLARARQPDPGIDTNRSQPVSHRHRPVYLREHNIQDGVCSTEGPDKPKQSVPMSTRTFKNSPGVISRVEQRDSGFDESILIESKPTSQTNSYAYRLDRADVDQGEIDVSDQTIMKDQFKDEIATKVHVSKQPTKADSILKRPQPMWNSVPPPVSVKSSHLWTQPADETVQITSTQHQHGKTTRDGSIKTPLSPTAVEAASFRSSEPSSVRFPDLHAFVGTHHRALGMHPTHKWLSPFKVGPTLPVIQTKPKCSMKLTEHRSQIGFTEHDQLNSHLPPIQDSSRFNLTDSEDGCRDLTPSKKLNQLMPQGHRNSNILPKSAETGEYGLCTTEPLGLSRLEAIPEPGEASTSRSGESKSAPASGPTLSTSPPIKRKNERVLDQAVLEQNSVHQAKQASSGLPAIVSSHTTKATELHALAKPNRTVKEGPNRQPFAAESFGKQKTKSLENVQSNIVTSAAAQPSSMPIPVSSLLPSNPVTTAAAKRKSLMDSLNIPMVSDTDFLDKRYCIGRTLGDGNFAVVRLARRRDTGQQYALKMIDKTKLKGKESMLYHEVTIMHQCNHPNIVRLYEEFETSKEIWLAMEYVKDGDLFDGITKAMKFSESTASGIVRDLASALFYLHCRSIVHRDLKPENVLLYRQPDGRLRVKLADFGLALEVKRDLHTICGTPTYIAPEILNDRGYGLEVDMWALGVITYIMLCGFAPFRSANRSQSKLFDAIKRGVFVYLSPYWDPISQSAKDLINRLLVVSPKRRLTALETLVHPWVFGEGMAHGPMDSHPSSDFEQRRLAYQVELENQANLVAAEKNQPVDKPHKTLVPVELPSIETKQFYLTTGKTSKPANSYSTSTMHLPALTHLR